jgi:hypothetical protein
MGGVLALVSAASWALSAAGQVPKTPTVTSASGNPTSAARLPYMAEFKILQLQRLTNGTAVPHEFTVITARDSQDRHMRATTVSPLWPDQTATTHFQVFDPVAHASFNWSFPGREATVMAIPFYGANLQGCGYASFGISYANAKTTMEDLGTKTIQGVLAHGRRFTTTATAEPIGKHKKHMQQPVTIKLRSTELWEAIDPGLAGLVVQEISEEAQSVKRSKELVNFSQSEPDAVFFRPPASYEIVNREVNADPCSSFENLDPTAATSPILP